MQSRKWAWIMYSHYAIARHHLLLALFSWNSVKKKYINTSILCVISSSHIEFQLMVDLWIFNVFSSCEIYLSVILASTVCANRNGNEVYLILTLVVLAPKTYIYAVEFWHDVGCEWASDIERHEQWNGMDAFSVICLRCMNMNTLLIEFSNIADKYRRRNKISMSTDKNNFICHIQYKMYRKSSVIRK